AALRRARALWPAAAGTRRAHRVGKPARHRLPGARRAGRRPRHRRTHGAGRGDGGGLGAADGLAARAARKAGACMARLILIAALCWAGMAHAADRSFAEIQARLEKHAVVRAEFLQMRTMKDLQRPQLARGHLVAWNAG